MRSHDQAPRSSSVMTATPSSSQVATANTRILLWQTLAVATTLLTLTSYILGSAAAKSLPGDALFGIRHLGTQITLSLAHTPLDRANALMRQLHSSVDDLHDSVFTHHSDGDVTEALSYVADDTRAVLSAVTTIQPGLDSDHARSDLAQTLLYEDITLHQTLPSASWAMEIAITRQLVGLGDIVPQITSVAATVGDNNDITLVIIGMHFDPEAQVRVDGNELVPIQRNADTQITVVAHVTHWAASPHTIGVINIDATIASWVMPIAR